MSDQQTIRHLRILLALKEDECDRLMNICSHLADDKYALATLVKELQQQALTLRLALEGLQTPP